MYAETAFTINNDKLISKLNYKAMVENIALTLKIGCPCNCNKINESTCKMKLRFIVGSLHYLEGHIDCSAN